MKDERVTQLITFRYFVTPEEIERESGLNSRFFEVVCYWHDKEDERENKEAGSNLPPSEFDRTLVKVTLNQSENVLPLYVIFEQIIKRCNDCRTLLFIEDDFLTEDEI